jgi:hypothetical protein
MDRIERPIEVLASKVFPSGGQLTKISVAGAVAYIRENAEPLANQAGDLHIARNVQSGSMSVQFLELCAPIHLWVKVASVIALEDQLKREVRQNEAFTAEWAEAELTQNGKCRDCGALLEYNRSAVCEKCERAAAMADDHLEEEDMIRPVEDSPDPKFD